MFITSSTYVLTDYNNESLAWLLFLDGCAVLQYIYCATHKNFKDLNINVDIVIFGQQDIFLLENQLPYRLLKWLMSLSEIKKELEDSISIYFLLMYILLWALGPLGPITLLVQHTYTCTALYLYCTLMPPI